MAPGVPLVARLAARRARTRAGIDAAIVGAVTDAELSRNQKGSCCVRTTARAYPTGHPCPTGCIDPDERVRIDEILSAARERSEPPLPGLV